MCTAGFGVGVGDEALDGDEAVDAGAPKVELGAPCVAWVHPATSKIIAKAMATPAGRDVTGRTLERDAENDPWTSRRQEADTALAAWALIPAAATMATDAPSRPAYEPPTVPKNRDSTPSLSRRSAASSIC